MENLKYKEFAESDPSISDLKGSFLKEKENIINPLPLTRTLTLVAQSFCGCGFTDVAITRTVPYDSPLQNGDTVMEIINGDEIKN